MTGARRTHAISQTALQDLVEKSDLAGGSALLLHLGALILCCAGAVMLPGIPGTICWMAYAVLLVFLFCPLHEVIHETAFASSRLNRLVGFSLGLVLLLPPGYFRGFHMAHHRYTQLPARDPELLVPKPATCLQYLRHISGIPYWISQARAIARYARGHVDAFMPASRHGALVLEARAYMAVYTAVLMVSVVTENAALWWYWALPVLAAQPALRLFLLAEHTGCPEVRGMFDNTRTTLTNPLMRRLCWNMNFHTEHHAYAGIPFHRLPEAHALLRTRPTTCRPGVCSGQPGDPAGRARERRGAAGMTNLVLNGSDLDPVTLNTVARDLAAVVELDSDGLRRVERARKRVLDALERGAPVYGLTTGLGSRASESLDGRQAANFSIHTLRGRAHATGEALPRGEVRAAMVVRLNTLLKGAAGADPAVLQCLRDCLNRGLTPVVGSIGSVGAGDLCQGATLGLALCGEGRINDRVGREMDAAAALSAAGIPPLIPGPRDGLALANHSAFSAARMALATCRVRQLLSTSQRAAALSLEAFVASPRALNPVIDRLRPQPGQQAAADELLGLLEGGRSLEPARAPRLQDPLSLRCVTQVHGAALATLDFAEEAVGAEINGAGDNPMVDLDGDRIISNGSFHTPLLTVVSQSLCQALVLEAQARLARVTKLLTERFSGLPQYLAAPGSDSNGFAPLLKVAEATLAQLVHGAMPVPVWPSINADGMEDVLTNAPAAIDGLGRTVALGERLCAIELMVACQALEMRNEPISAHRLGKVRSRVRAVVEPLAEDRPLGGDVEELTGRVRAGDFATI